MRGIRPLIVAVTNCRLDLLRHYFCTKGRRLSTPRTCTTGMAFRPFGKCDVVEDYLHVHHCTCCTIYLSMFLYPEADSKGSVGAHGVWRWLLHRITPSCRSVVASHATRSAAAPTRGTATSRTRLCTLAAHATPVEAVDLSIILGTPYPPKAQNEL